MGRISHTYMGRISGRQDILAADIRSTMPTLLNLAATLQPLGRVSDAIRILKRSSNIY